MAHDVSSLNPIFGRLSLEALPLQIRVAQGTPKSSTMTAETRTMNRTTRERPRFGSASTVSATDTP